MTTDTTPPASRADRLMTIDLGKPLKADWVKWCADRGLVPGKVMRGMVERALAEGLELAAGPSGEKVRVVVLDEPDRGAKVGREIQLTPSENKAAEAAAKAEGYGFQEWVIAAVRAALANAPSYGQAELEALTQSNAAMAQVAVELAALRRQEPDAQLVARLADLESEIRHHVETVSAAMAQGARRWQLKV
ncbi:hypothetical protein EIP75_21735 [Aquabacterium soli]|uniref:Plasmid stabilization protein n=1 Tax=Aquabacterium soli TaxID=2493092 RepID=A0A426V2R1_9BURK|nr:hypothetical protein [Aquabacterium soli]RRS01199.1 hypothetical protein EIP75_21735 [Aquabacterium soli]